MTVDWFTTIGERRALPWDTVGALHANGFVVIPGPISADRLPDLAAAYDSVMSGADATDRNTGRSGTTRVHDFVNRGPAFDDVYIYEPILEACCRVIARPFKLSTFLGRTLNPNSPPQGLHADFPRGADDCATDAWPMIGFIVMVDDFTSENGATRFVPGSHLWSEPPKGLPADHDGQVAACGLAGSVIVYNGSLWHGHGANVTDQPRRSLQGAFIRRDARSTGNLAGRMRPETLGRIEELAKYLLIDEA